MANEVPAFVLRGCFEDSADAVPQGIDCSFFGGFEMGLQFGEEVFDGIEIRRIGWQEEQMRTPFRDRIADRHRLVAAKVIHDNGITGPEFWCETLSDIHLEDKPVHGAIHH